jgi:hypothetical protein
MKIFSCLLLIGIFWMRFTLDFWTIRIRISILNEDLDLNPGNNIMQIPCGFGSETFILCWAKLMDNDTNCTVLYCTVHYSITLSMKVKFYILLIYCNQKNFFGLISFLRHSRTGKNCAHIEIQNFLKFWDTLIQMTWIDIRWQQSEMTPPDDDHNNNNNNCLDDNTRQQPEHNSWWQTELTTPALSSMVLSFEIIHSRFS